MCDIVYSCAWCLAACAACPLNMLWLLWCILEHVDACTRGPVDGGCLNVRFFVRQARFFVRQGLPQCPPRAFLYTLGSMYMSVLAARTCLYSADVWLNGWLPVLVSVCLLARVRVLVCQCVCSCLVLIDAFNAVEHCARHTHASTRKHTQAHTHTHTHTHTGVAPRAAGARGGGAHSGALAKQHLWCAPSSAHARRRLSCSAVPSLPRHRLV